MLVRLDGDASLVRIPPELRGAWRNVLTGDELTLHASARVGWLAGPLTIALLERLLPGRLDAYGRSASAGPGRSLGPRVAARAPEEDVTPPPPTSLSAPAPPSRRSFPAPPRSLSAPAPPSMRSAPAPPASRSAPAPPMRRSAPAPPSIWSLPAPPQTTSLPPRPAITSFPPSPAMTSARGVPRSRLRPAVPTIVARLPAQTAVRPAAPPGPPAPPPGRLRRLATLQPGDGDVRGRPALGGSRAPGHEDPPVGPEGDRPAVLEGPEVHEGAAAGAEARVERPVEAEAGPRPCRPCRTLPPSWSRPAGSCRRAGRPRAAALGATESTVVEPSPAKAGSGSPFASSRATARSSARPAEARSWRPPRRSSVGLDRHGAPVALAEVDQRAPGAAAEGRVVVARGIQDPADDDVAGAVPPDRAGVDDLAVRLERDVLDLHERAAEVLRDVPLPAKVSSKKPSVSPRRAKTPSTLVDRWPAPMSVAVRRWCRRRPASRRAGGRAPEDVLAAEGELLEPVPAAEGRVEGASRGGQPRHQAVVRPCSPRRDDPPVRADRDVGDPVRRAAGDPQEPGSAGAEGAVQRAVRAELRDEPVEVAVVDARGQGAADHDPPVGPLRDLGDEVGPVEVDHGEAGVAERGVEVAGRRDGPRSARRQQCQGRGGRGDFRRNQHRGRPYIPLRARVKVRWRRRAPRRGGPGLRARP